MNTKKRVGRLLIANAKLFYARGLNLTTDILLKVSEGLTSLAGSLNQQQGRIISDLEKFMAEEKADES